MCHPEGIPKRVSKLLKYLGEGKDEEVDWSSLGRKAKVEPLTKGSFVGDSGDETAIQEEGGNP